METGTRARSLRFLLGSVLGLWLGSWTCFALLVAPTAFRVLPSTEVAGQLVGPVLATLHLSGALAGALAAALAAALGRGRLAVALPLLLAAATLVSEFGVTPQLTALRELAFGPEGNVEASARYRQLHGLSMAIFCAVLLGVIALGWIHSRDHTSQASDSA